MSTICMNYGATGLGPILGIVHNSELKHFELFIEFELEHF